MKRFDPNTFHRAVMVIAMQRAKRAVQNEIRARGEKIANYSAKEITLLAEDYLHQHLEPLVTKTAADLAAWPEFARHLRSNVESAAQQTAQPISTASVVQNLCSKWRAHQ